jgi:outer membrane protein assembly factor BamA
MFKISLAQRIFSLFYYDLSVTDLFMRKLISGLSFLLVSMSSMSQDNELIINNIQISGNRTTRENVIIREMTFKKGDTISVSRLEQLILRSRENILNTSLFNFVTITTSNVSSDHIDIYILVEERWYTWPSVILKYDDRNFSAWLKAGDLSKSKYGFSVEQYNCFGRRENLKLIFLFGYAKQFSVSYRNIALDKNRKHFIGGDIELIRQDEIIYKTQDNEPSTYRDNFQSVFERRKYTLNYLYRPQIDNLHNFYLNYFEYKIADTVVKLNPDFFIGGNNNLKCFTFDYVYSDDKRDIKAYPLKGSYFELLISQTISLPFSKTSFSSTAIVPGFYKYFEINKRFYYAAGINLKLSNNSSYSYFYARSVGYKYNLHGFEYNTIEGQHFIIIKNLFKIAVLKPRVSEIRFIPFTKFKKIHYAVYFNIFSDCGYVANKYRTPDNSYANKFLISGGAGVDLVTYYDVTIRADYAINGFGKSGVFIHLTAPLNK